MPNAFYAKKRVFIYHFGEVCICCANQSIITPISYVPKVVPTIPSTKEGNEYNHTFQVKQKAPIQHHNFLKTQQNEIHRSRKKKLKLPYFVLPLSHLYNYNLSLYLKNQFVCYCLSLIHF